MIYTLPGMGADNTMHRGVWRGLPDSTFLDWPTYGGEQSIEALARRIVDETGIQDGAVLIGTSLGGMVACEIARLRRLRRLILISSAIEPKEVSRVLDFLHPSIVIAPIKLAQCAAARLPSHAARMFSRSEPAFLRAMCRAVFRWEGLDRACIEPLRLHGRKDRLIPLPPNVHLVLDGGHLVAITHAEECVRFILASLAPVGARSDA